MKKYILSIVIIINTIGVMSGQDIKLGAIFSDNMVLQQKSKAKLWGQSKPNAKLLIEGSWGSKSATIANEQGKWMVMLETKEAGGPFTLTISSETTKKEIKNVMLGEVWVCSGQSNMEMPLSGWLPNDTIEGSKQEIASPSNPNIRMFTVQRAFSLIEQTDCMGNWVEATPQTKPNFSATAYFFAKKLYNELHVPIGLIHSSWGGTSAEAWTSAEDLGAMYDFAETVHKFQSLITQQQQYTVWLESHKKVLLTNDVSDNKWKNLNFDDPQCSQPQFDETGLPTMKIPVAWESTEVGTFDGTIWFRKWIDIPDTMQADDWTIILPGVDDMDQTWINGVEVGAIEVPGFWQTPRHYEIPKQLLKTGKNLIAIRVIDNQGGGGIYDKQMLMELTHKNDTSKKISLKGAWLYLPVAEYTNGVFYVFDAQQKEGLKRPKLSADLDSSTPTVLFNAMIKPISGYTIAGTIWYQGETNVGRAKQYQTLFPTMIQSWRKSWGQGDFPFYFVQIAPWEYGNKNNSESAELRNAQRLTLGKTKNTAMVVTLDIGNVKNVHPSKKKEVGERLALIALAKNYAKPVTYSGPLYKSKSITGNKITLQFDYANNGLILTNADSTGFEIAGTDRVFVPAKAVIVGNKIEVNNENISSPVYVRYAYRNGSKATLFNVEGLPASTFETE